MNNLEGPLLLFNLDEETSNLLMQPDVEVNDIQSLYKNQLLAVLFNNGRQVNLLQNKPALAEEIHALIQARGVLALSQAQIAQMLQTVAQDAPGAVVQPRPAAAAEPAPVPQAQMAPPQDARRMLPECIICLANAMECVFSRCGHLGVCFRCRGELFRVPQPVDGLPAPQAERSSVLCPVCRKKHKRSQVRPIYLA